MSALARYAMATASQYIVTVFAGDRRHHDDADATDRPTDQRSAQL